MKQVSLKDFLKVTDKIDRAEDDAVQEILKAVNYMDLAISYLGRCENNFTDTNGAALQATRQAVKGLKQDRDFLKKLVHILNSEEPG